MRFISACLLTGVTAAGVSLAWPRFTSQQRPAILQEIRDAVIKTPIGQQTANVLGVTDEKNIELLNINQIINTAVSGVKEAAQNRVRTVLIQNAINQLSTQLDQLPKEQKQEIQEMLCKPADKQ